MSSPPSPPAVSSCMMRDKMNGISRNMNQSSRPLPDIPSKRTYSLVDVKIYKYFLFVIGPRSTKTNGFVKQPVEQPLQKISVFDSIRRPTSVTMEKIKSTTAATLDRMAILQQRYRQHKEAMNSDNSSERSRRTSSSISNLEHHVCKLCF